LSEPTAGQMITPTLRLERPLGEGGMGAVWIAEHLGLQTQVVVKFMAEELAATDEGKNRFSKEAAATAQVRSPHVVQTLDYGVTDDNVPYLVMELLDGHDLGREIDQCGKLKPETVVALVIQLSRALSRVHECGIIHRDIKPNNIFLCDAGGGEIFVKLLDFGVAKTHASSGLGNTTNTGTMLGTPYYMSPEQIMGAKEIDARSDLWSVAVVVYEALTGGKPFDGDTVGGLAVKIMRDEIPVPSKVNPELPASFDSWFSKACAREPEDRFPSARELSDALAASFSMPDSLQGSQPRFAPVIANSVHPGANTDEAFAPTALDASTPGVREGVSRDATMQSQETARDAKVSRGWMFGLAMGVGAIGLALGLGLPRLLSSEASAQPPVGVVAEAASVVHVVSATHQDDSEPPLVRAIPAASSAPMVATASASGSVDPPQPSKTVRAAPPPATKNGGAKPPATPPAATTASAAPAPPTKNNPTPTNNDDIW
jgi:eukaryotic-like serine/threonine-protein kinase